LQVVAFLLRENECKVLYYSECFFMKQFSPLLFVTKTGIYVGYNMHGAGRIGWTMLRKGVVIPLRRTRSSNETRSPNTVKENVEELVVLLYVIYEREREREGEREKIQPRGK
jgi:hypothetical protein